MLADLGRTARDSPQDVEAWIRAGQAHQRAAQFDPGLRAEALGFFTHALDLAPKHPDALRGKADLLYDQERFAEAIAAYDAYLVERPDDLSARTDLATMHFYGGDVPRAMAIYRDVLARNPSFVQAHMNLGIALYRQGDGAGALSEFETARSLAGDDQLRRQIDGMIASIRGAPPPSTGAPPDRTAFQAAVEQALRSQQIVGAKITRFEWSVAAGRVILHDFPMDAMPAAVREKFLARLRDTLRDAARTNGITEPPRLEIADAGSGVVMATVSP